MIQFLALQYIAASYNYAAWSNICVYCSHIVVDYCKGCLTIFGIILIGIVLMYFIAQKTKLVRYSETLPYPSNNFVGRENELQNLTEQLKFDDSTVRVLNIIGPPGFGKSTLAIHLGHRLIDQKVHVYYINMAEFLDRNVKVVLAEKILGSKKRLSFDKLLKWVREKNGEKFVFILDNCDEILNEQAKRFQQMIMKIIQASTTVKIITTSREFTLGLEYYSYQLRELSPDGAISLLDQKLSHLSLSLKEKERIAELTGNVPLALHIVASLLLQPHPPSPAKVIEELENDPLNVLSPQELPAEHQLNASISLSYKYLEKSHRRAAYFLSLFPGSFSKTSAIGVCLEYQKSKGIVSDCALLSDSILKNLVHLSLLEYNERSKRYLYHRLIKEYFVAKITENDNANISREFMVGFRYHFLKELHQHTIDFETKYINSLKFLDAERHNIHSLLRDITDPGKLPRRSLLLTIDSVTHALQVGYLNCRFTTKELRSVLRPTLDYLDTNVRLFLLRAGTKESRDLNDKPLLLKEFYQRTYIELLIMYSELIENKKTASAFMEKRKGMVELLTNDVGSYADKGFGINDPRLSPNALVLSVISRHRSFFRSLGDLYLALNEHSMVVQCHLRLVKGAEDCEEKHCLYNEIALMYWDARNYEDAAQFFELSLQHDLNSEISKADTLMKLIPSYKLLESNEWFWERKKEQGAIDRLLDVCKQIRNMEDDLAIVNHWDVIVRIITVLKEGGIDVEFIKDRMFSAMSAPKIQFQLQPKNALKLLNIAQKNDSRTVEWGLLLLKSLKNYNNFSTNEQHEVLDMRLKVSLALLSTNRTEGIEGIENIYRRIMESDDTQKESLKDLRRHTCSSLILASKSLGIINKYIYPCYKDSVLTLIEFVPKLYLYKFPTKFPKHLAYAIFVIPLDRHTFSYERQDVFKTAKRQQQTRSSDMISLEPNGIADILNIQIEWNFLYYHTWCNQLETIWKTLKSDILLIIINVASVLVRLWIFLTALFTYLGFALIYLSLYLDYFQIVLYTIILNDSTSRTCTLYFIIGYSNVLIFLSKLLSRCLQNSWGYFWIESYIRVSPYNLAQVHPFRIEHYAKLCSDKCLSTKYNYGTGITKLMQFLKSHPILDEGTYYFFLGFSMYLIIGLPLQWYLYLVLIFGYSI